MGGVQVALDIGLDRGIQDFRAKLRDELNGDTGVPQEEPRKPTREYEVKQIEYVKATVIGSVASAVEQVVHDITKQITQRVIAKLRKELKEKSLRRLEKVLEKFTERKLEQGLDESVRLLTEEIAKDSIDETSFIAEIDESFGDNVKNYLSSLTKGPRFPLGKAFMAAVGILAIAGIAYALLPDNESPVAEASIEWIEGLTVAFSSEGSYDPDGDIEWYYWEFGDGAASEESNPEHTYEEEGDYTVILTVGDDNGAADEDQTYVNIDYAEYLPDLVITEVWLVNHGENENRVHYLIENQSDAAASTCVTRLKFGERQCEDSISKLGAGQSMERQFGEDCWLSENDISEFVLYVYADADGDIDESNEQNNTMSYKHE